MNNVVQISDFPAQPATVDSEARELNSPLPVGYALFDDGVYVLAEEEAGEPIFICTPLRVDAGFADQAGTGWGKLISVKSPNGIWHDVPVMNAHRSLDVLPGDDVLARIQDNLPAPQGRRDQLIRLAATGRLALAERATFEAELAHIAPDFGWFVSDLAALSVDARPDDLDLIDRAGALRQAAEALMAEASDQSLAQTARDVAASALSRLYAYAQEERP